MAASRTMRLANYRIQIPITWVVGYSETTHFSAMTAPGIGRIGFLPYWRNEVPVSEMGFYPVSHPEQQFTKNVPLEGATVIAKRSFAFGNESLNCWDLIQHNKYVGSFPKDPSIANIRCSSDSEHFYAYFVGWRGDSASFYNTLQSIHYSN